MTETFFPTSTPEMVQELRAEVLNLQKQISELQNKAGQYTDMISRMRRNVTDFEMQLKELYRNGEFDEETACALAAPFDIQLTEELQICITVTYRGTVDVPINTNPDDVDWSNEISFDFDPYQSEMIFDIYEDDMEVEVA